MPILRILARKFILGLHYLHHQCKLIHTDLKPENVLLKLTKDEINDIKNRGKRTESILKNIGHKLQDPNSTKDKPIEIINMNKKKTEKVTIPKH